MSSTEPQNKQCEYCEAIRSEDIKLPEHTTMEQHANLVKKDGELDEILRDAYRGMYCRDEDGNYQPMHDAYNVMQEALKKDLLEWLES